MPLTLPTRLLLTSSLVALERRLSLDQTVDLLGMCDQDIGSLDELGAHGSTPDREVRHLPSPPDGGLAWDSEIHVHMPPATPAVAPLPLPPFKFPSSPSTRPRRTLVDDLMRADL